MRNIWNKIVGLLLKVPIDKWLHFGAGVLVAAFFALTLHLEWCIAPAVFFGLAKEAFDYATTRNNEWLDLFATVMGGLVIQIFTLLG